MIRGCVVALVLTCSIASQPMQLATLATPAPVSSFMLGRAGTLGAAVCEDRKLRLWALPHGLLVREFDLGKRSVDSAVMSADSRWIAVGDHNGEYTVWDVSTGAEKLRVQIPYYPFGLAFSPDGNRLAIAPAGEPVQVYDVATRTKLFELSRVVGGTAALAFSRDGRRIGTGDADTVVRIYDGRNGELLARNADFLLVPLAATFTAEGKRLLTGGADKIIAMLDSSTGKAVRRSGKLVDPVAYLEVSPDGRLTSATLMHADNMLLPAPVVIWETESGRKVQEWLPGSRVLGAGWIEGDHLLAAIGTPKGLQIWRLR
jgi:WD40 repeat protein